MVAVGDLCYFWNYDIFSYAPEYAQEWNTFLLITHTEGVCDYIVVRVDSLKISSQLGMGEGFGKCVQN